MKVEVELTSKKIKLQQLLAVLLFFGSVILGAVCSLNLPGPAASVNVWNSFPVILLRIGAGISCLGGVTGFVWMIVAALMAWWHHG
jgi:hypothetical protein